MLLPWPERLGWAPGLARGSGGSARGQGRAGPTVPAGLCRPDPGGASTRRKTCIPDMPASRRAAPLHIPVWPVRAGTERKFKVPGERDRLQAGGCRL